jgi:murein DD-endopeptidase MepM/ murein hydrolase activator NlpD
VAGCSVAQSTSTTDVADDTVPPAITVLVPRVPTTLASQTGVTSILPAGPQHSYPIDIFVMSSFQPEHHDYPAADMFAACGSKVVSPATGTIGEVSRFDLFDEAVNDPATRGGLFVSVLGIDNVRYYMAHLQEIAVGVEPGVAVVAGQAIATVGDTGNAGACHVHFGLSPICSATEWWVRRGVIWPGPYLDGWLVGGDISPVQEIQQWTTDHPGVCTDPNLMPWPST